MTSEHSSNYRRFTLGAIISLSGDIIGKFLVLITTLIVARLFLTNDAGMYFWFVSLNEVLSSVAIIGLRQTTVRFIAISMPHDTETAYGTVKMLFLFTLASSCTIAAILWLFSAQLLPKDFSYAVEATKWFIWSIPFEASRKLLLGATEGLKKMQYSAVVESFLIPLLRLTGIYFLAVALGLGLKGAAIAHFIAMSLATLLLCIRVYRFLPISLFKRYKFNRKAVFKFALPIFPQSIIFDASRQFDILLLGWVSSPAMVTIFSVAVRFCTVAGILYRAIQQAISPFLAEFFGKEDKETASQLYRFAVKWAYLGSIPAYSILCICAKPIMELFGITSPDGVACLVILAIVRCFAVPSNLSGVLLIMSNNQRLELVNTLFYAGTLIISTLLFVPLWHSIGASIAQGASLFVLCGLRWKWQNARLGIPLFTLTEIKITILAIVISIVYSAVFSPSQLTGFFSLCLWGGGFFITFYCVAIFLFADENDKKIYKSLFKFRK